MASYVITGASRGLGFTFLEVLSKNSANTVIGLARNKAALDDKVKKAGLTNVTIVEGDVGDLASMKAAAEATAKLTGGGLDILINNAGLVSDVSEFKTQLDFDDDFEAMETEFLDSFKVNALGFLKAAHAFLPLIKKGTEKKIVNISTGMADIDLINDYSIAVASPYSVSKAAANAIVAKYNAALKHEGILFLSVSPGYVATERNAEGGDPEKAMELGMKFAAYAPDFQRPLTPEESVTAVLGVIEKKTVEGGDGGAFISHLGTKRWL